MNKALSLAVAATLSCASLNSEAQTMIGKTTDVAAIANGDRMNAETLWAMGRIGGAAASPDGKTVVYQVGYYSVKQNKSHQMLYTVSADGKKQHSLTTTAASESDATWIDGGKRIAFLTGGQLWSMNADGTDRRQFTKSKIDIEGYIFSPDEKKVILIKSLPYHESIKKNPDDLPLASGRLVTDLNYRHWDHYVETVAHPFVADVTADGIGDGTDIIEGEPFECPMAPFGGAEQLAWSPDSKHIAYTCRKKTGVDYATSTDSDIYLYDVQTGKTKNLCKPAGYKPLPYNPTKTKKDQRLNHQGADYNMGYDTNPQFSPDGKYVAWQSMKRDGYESDRNRLCVYNLLTGEKTYVAEKFDSNVDAFCWAPNSRNLYFIGCWHACVNMYQTDLNGDVRQLTNDWMDFGSLQMLGNTGKILASRHSISQADELYIITPGKDPKKTKVQQLTFENKAFYDQLEMGKVQERWVKTTDGKQMQVWVILPPHFDPNKKYPTLLFCEGGPQSPVSQFWSYRWNFQIMAAHDYIVIAPNRRGLPGYGSEWNEAVSGDWTGQCMDDYLSAIDDAANNLPSSTRIVSAALVPASAASRSTTSQATTTSASRHSSLTTEPSTSSRCTPTPRRHGSPTGSTTTLTGTRISPTAHAAPTKTRRISSSTSGIRLSSASTAKWTTASTPTRASELSTQHVCAAYPPSFSSSPTRTTGCSNRRTACSGSAPSSDGSTSG